LELSSTDDIQHVAAEVNEARKNFAERHKDLPPLQRIEAMLTDIFGLLYTEFYVRRRE
jgi:DNA-directed RNA polymerase specialized sigma24 family protein